jgi:tripartite-type tricarboxylate transporter receptor subunit TctC
MQRNFLSISSLLIGAAVATVLISITGVYAQDAGKLYPSKLIRLVNPYAPGGSVDFVARPIAQKLSEVFGQQMFMDYRPGAGTTIGTHIVARAAPDGYTLLATTNAIAMNVSLFRKLPFDPVTDLTPIALTVQIPNVLAVNAGSPVTSVQELINLARARPGQISYGSSGYGSVTHLAMELLKSMTKIDMVHIGYKGGGPAMTALLAGEVPVAIVSIPGILPHVRAGKVRLLAITAAKRSETAPDLPTIAESGVPGYDVTVWHAMFAPRGTPRMIVDRLNGEVNRILKMPEVRELFLNSHLVAPMGGPSQALADALKADIARWAIAARSAGITPE